MKMIGFGPSNQQQVHVLESAATIDHQIDQVLGRTLLGKRGIRRRGAEQGVYEHRVV